MQSPKVTQQSHVSGGAAVQGVALGQQHDAVEEVPDSSSGLMDGCDDQVIAAGAQAADTLGHHQRSIGIQSYTAAGIKVTLKA